MAKIAVTRKEFLDDAQGKTFADVANSPDQPFELVIEFFNDAARQRRMEESELHHDRAPLAGVVRELESLPEVGQYLGDAQTTRNNRFRQAIGVLVRIIMEKRGWKKTGRKGSLGVRATKIDSSAAHNSGGLAFWFVRAERYELPQGMPYLSVRRRLEELPAVRPKKKHSVTASTKKVPSNERT